MNDWQALIFRLREAAAESAAIRDFADNPTKREFFSGLSSHLAKVADDVEKTVAVKCTRSCHQSMADDHEDVEHLKAREFTVLSSASPVVARSH